MVADTKIDLQGTSVTPFWESKQLVATALWDAAIGRGVMALGFTNALYYQN